jgi:hypothetical protein
LTQQVDDLGPSSRAERARHLANAVKRASFAARSPMPRYSAASQDCQAQRNHWEMSARVTLTGASITRMTSSSH